MRSMRTISLVFSWLDATAMGSGIGNVLYIFRHLSSPLLSLTSLSDSRSQAVIIELADSLFSGESESSFTGIASLVNAIVGNVHPACSMQVLWIPSQSSIVTSDRRCLSWGSSASAG